MADKSRSRRRVDTTPPDPPPGTWRTLREGEVHQVDEDPAPPPAPARQPTFVVPPEAMHPGIDPAPELGKGE